MAENSERIHRSSTGNAVVGSTSGMSNCPAMLIALRKFIIPSFLGRHNGSYGPIPAMRLPGLLTMPFNSTAIKKLYCVGDSCFPGQGLNAVAFSGFACAHKIGADLGLNSWKLPD